MSATEVKSATFVLDNIPHFPSEQYFEMKCCPAASLTTMQAVLQSMHGFSNWMKDELHVFSWKSPSADPPLAALPAGGKILRRWNFRLNYQWCWVLRHLHGLLIPGGESSIITGGTKIGVSDLGSTGLNCWDMKLFMRSPMPSIKPSSIPPTTADPT